MRYEVYDNLAIIHRVRSAGLHFPLEKQPHRLEEEDLVVGDERGN